MAGRWTIERAMEEAPPAFHPLAGCDLETLKAHLAQASDLSERSAKQRKKSIAAVYARQPFTMVERAVFGRKVENYKLPHPPLFIVGHWRSGTTHLHNLMTQGARFSTIDFGQTAMPHNLLNPTRVIGRAVISSMMPKTRGMDKVEMGITEPQEEEMAIGNMNPLCYYNVFYYPKEMKHHFDRAIFLENTSAEERAAFEAAYVKLLRKLSIAGNGERLLLKNPASTARVELLDRWFPGSGFIYIVRNPFEVFASMLHHYPRIFSAFAWQDFEEIDLEEMVFYKYGRLMRGYLEQRGTVADRLVETSYEKIVDDPAGEIGGFYDKFDLPAKDEAIAAIRSYVEDRKGYRRNQYQLTKAQVQRIREEWGFALEEWGYDVPKSIEVVE